MSLKNDLQNIYNAKNDIKSALINMGQNATNDITTYSNLISNISTGINTADANAIADDILSPKTAYVNGTKLTGTIQVETINTDPKMNYQYYISNPTSMSFSGVNQTGIKDIDLRNNVYCYLSFTTEINGYNSIKIRLGRIENNVIQNYSKEIVASDFINTEDFSNVKGINVKDAKFSKLNHNEIWLYVICHVSRNSSPGGFYQCIYCLKIDKTTLNIIDIIKSDNVEVSCTYTDSSTSHVWDVLTIFPNQDALVTISQGGYAGGQFCFIYATYTFSGTSFTIGNTRKSSSSSARSVIQ